MNRTVLFLASAALPAATLAGFHFWRPAGSGLSEWERVGLPTLAMVTAAYAVGLLVYLFWLARTQRDLAREADFLRRSQQDLTRQKREMQSTIELLSATREVCLVVNGEVEARGILEKVLRITAGLVGARGGSLTIHLRDPETERMVPRAQLRGEDFYYERGIESKSDTAVLAAVDHRRPFVSGDADSFVVTVPLVSDRELVGILEVRTPADWAPAERAERVRRLEDTLAEFSRYLSIAVKTPDLYTRAVEDGLTRLCTKRHFLEQIAAGFQQARRRGDPLSLIMVDIDFFKRINDTWGHPTGDRVLRGIAEILRKSLRWGGDAAFSGYRYGGEELSIILPQTAAAKAAQVAERLRAKIEEKKFTSESGESFQVTASLGVAALAPGMEAIDALIAAADAALYRSKKGGRNRVTVADPGSMRATA